MTPVKVLGLWRYPVKSMRGERVDQVRLEETGLVGDRRYGILDPRRGTILSAKREGGLLEAQALMAGDELTIRLPTGETVFGLGPTVDRALSDWLGRPVHLVEASAHGRATYENISDFEDDGSEPTTSECPPGSFVDACPVHLVTTASLEAVATERPDLAWDLPRFRPNIVVEVGAHEGEGTVELGWAGHRVELGSAEIDVWLGCPRCVVPTRSQPGGLERQLDILRHLKAGHDSLLGVLAGVSRPGEVVVGDRVSVL